MQGNIVINSASPGLDGYRTPTPEVVTVTDSSGKQIPLQNSQGGDSIQVTNNYVQTTCLGVSNGVATLTNGRDTWKCEALSCGMAIMSSSINGGACSPGANNITNNYDNDKTPYFDDGKRDQWLQNEFAQIRNSVNAITVTMNGNMAAERAHADSLARARDQYWRAAFGDDMSNFNEAVQMMGNLVSVIPEGNAQVVSAVNSASSKNSTDLANATNSIVASNDQIRIAVVNSISASSNKIVAAIQSASSYNQDIITTVRDTVHETNRILRTIEEAVGDTGPSIRASVRSLENAVSSLPRSIDSSLTVNNDRLIFAVSGSSRDVVHAVSASSVNVANAVNSGVSVGNEILTTVRDTVHETNQILRRMDNTLSSLPRAIDSGFTMSLNQFASDQLVIIMDSNVQKVTDAIEGMNLNVNIDSVRINVPHDTTLDSIKDALKARSDFNMPPAVRDTYDFKKIYKQGFDSAQSDTGYAVDSSLHNLIKSASYVDGSDFDFTELNVDSVTSEINRKLDSSNVALNLMSDSMVRAYADSMMKYSGIDRGAPAIRRFFSQGGTGCPRNCLDITLSNPFFSGAGQTRIDFSTYLCDMHIFANYSVLDFIKLILRLMTSLLCLMFIWNAVGKKGDKK